MSRSIFSTTWKSFFIVSIFKKGDRCDIKSFRGIAILSAIPRLFEKLVFNVFALLFPSIIQTDQHGFMKGRSTNSNLVTINLV
jgi:hypothetical protein